MSYRILNFSTERQPAFDSSLGDAPLTGSSFGTGEPTKAPFGGKLLWVGNATCIIEYANIRFMTDPNFLHQGDHVHLGPGVTAQRIKDPAFDYESCPAVDFILLSHLHEDHFDNLVAEHVRKSLPIVSTSHACTHLRERGHTSVHPLDTWDKFRIVRDGTEITITAMPGKHTVGPVIEAVNELFGAVPPVMGSMVAFEKSGLDSTVEPFNLYISGDTLYYDDLKEIHTKFPNIHLALIHLGGTTLPVIRVMVTMDAEQGIKLLCALQPDQAIPIHFDDYSVFESPLSDFQDAVKKAGWEGRVIYLQRGQQFQF